jgi:predicted transcriptional regulator of viral defense system
MKSERTEEALEFIKTKGFVRTRDLTALGIRRDYLATLLREGLVERVGRGIYTLPGFEATEYHSLAEASKRVPRGIACLLSALRFHGLTTQNPSRVWMAIDRKARLPELDTPLVQLVRFSGAALNHGIEEHTIEGVPVRVYNPAKTVADCFKYRNKIGLDVALEALRDCWKQRRATMDQLWDAAETCRVAKIMRPYLESLV